jgi:hypothetical protein
LIVWDYADAHRVLRICRSGEKCLQANQLVVVNVAGFCGYVTFSYGLCLAFYFRQCNRAFRADRKICVVLELGEPCGRVVFRGDVCQ